LDSVFVEEELDSDLLSDDLLSDGLLSEDLLSDDLLSEDFEFDDEVDSEDVEAAAPSEDFDSPLLPAGAGTFAPPSLPLA